MIIKRSDIKGKFYKDKALTEPLFYGQLQYDENMWKIKILDFEIPKDRLQFGGLTLYTMISDGDNKVPCSFFNCTTSFQDFIAFSSYTINHNFDCYRKKNCQSFIEKETKFKRISVAFQNLDHWLWDTPGSAKTNNNLYAKFIDKAGNRVYADNLQKANEFTVKCNKINRKIHFKYTDKFYIVIKSTPAAYPVLYPDIKFRQYCYIDIVSKEKQPIEFFYDIIGTLNVYLGILWLSPCKINDIYSFKQWKYRKTFFSNNLDMVDMVENKSYFFSDMYYQKIKDCFPESLDKFFSLYSEFPFLIGFLSDNYSKTFLDFHLAQQIQVLESYGNLKSNGANGTKNNKDLTYTFDSVTDNVFNNLFVYNSPGNDYYKSVLFGPIKDMRKSISFNCTQIRNHIIHPCFRGKQKTLTDDSCNISENFILTNGAFNYEALGILSHRLKRMIKYLFYKEIGLEEFYTIQ